MLPYWLLFLMFAIGALQAAPAGRQAVVSNGPAHDLSRGGPTRPRTGPLFFAATALTALLIGLRFEVGADWVPYELIFRDIGRRDLLGALAYGDPAYSLLNWLIAKLGLKIWAVNLACGALFSWGLVRFARVQPRPWLVIVIAIPYLIIGVAMGYSRQAVAIGFCLAGLAAISNGRFRSFVLWIMVAALFHRTAIVLLPVVALSYAKNRLQTVALTALALAIGYYFLLRPALDQFLSTYVQRVYVAEGAGIRLGMNVVAAASFAIYSGRFGLSDVERKTWRNIAIAATLLFFVWMFIESTVAVDRIGLYLIPLQLFVMSRLPDAFGTTNRTSSVAVFTIVLFYALVLFVWLNFSNHADYWIPYKLYPIFS